MRLPLTGAKIPKIGKRGFRSQKTPISHHHRKGCSEPKTPHFETEHYKEMVIFLTRNTLFRGGAKLSGAGDSRESFAIETPIFVARRADSHESLALPIRANHATDGVGLFDSETLFSRFWGFWALVRGKRIPHNVMLHAKEELRQAEPAEGATFELLVSFKPAKPLMSRQEITSQVLQRDMSMTVEDLSQGEKPPKIRKKSSQEQSSWELLDLLPLKRQKK